MIYVGVRDLKAKLSEYLDKAKLGQEIIVTEHGNPIVRFIREPIKEKSTMQKLYTLAEKGLIELPKTRKSSQSNPPLKTKSRQTASELLLKDR